MSSPLVVMPLLAVLWIGCGRSESTGSIQSGCDNGKILIEKDQPWVPVRTCPASSRSLSSQSLPSIATVYDTQPARQICMDTPITYNHTIPNSGPYRPVGAEGGEYLYCPPQRWLNNLHSGATVFLYHPCAPQRERVRLSILARSCLSDYIITPHPDLSEQRPLALVSWGRSLQLFSVTSSGVCDWLKRTTNDNNHRDAVQTRKYNLLLAWPSEKHDQLRLNREQSHKSVPQFVKHCCEKILGSFLEGGMKEETLQRSRVNKVRKRRSYRQSRAAIQSIVRKGVNEREEGNGTADVTSQSTNQMPGTMPSSQEPGNLRGKDVTSVPDSDLGPWTQSTPGLHPSEVTKGHPTQESEPQNQGLPPETVPPLGSKASGLPLSPQPGAQPTPGAALASKPEPVPRLPKQDSTDHSESLHPDPPRTESPNFAVGVKPSRNAIPRQQNLIQPTPGAALASKPEPVPGLPKPDSTAHPESLHPDPPRTESPNFSVGVKPSRNGIPRQQNLIPKPESSHSEMKPGPLSLTTEKTNKHRVSGGSKPTKKDSVPEDAVVDVRQREAESKNALGDKHVHSGSESKGAPVPGFASPHHPHLKPHTHRSHPQAVTHKSLGLQGHPATATPRERGVPRTPRTDEAVWAAAALGFLLVLLALSVLHTRLYRHWRTTPSMYWHDPRQDYDSVADVIRRRLRIASRRKRRSSLGRRQECALLPTSSSDEDQ